MISGILRWDSSLMAIWSASVSPSSGTSTGAFILENRNTWFRTHETEGATRSRYTPDLQRSRPQHTRTLVLCQIRRRDAHFVGLSLALHACPSLGRLRRFAVLWFLCLRAVRASVAICLLALAGGLAVWEICREQIVVLVLTKGKAAMK